MGDRDGGSGILTLQFNNTPLSGYQKTTVVTEDSLRKGVQNRPNFNEAINRLVGVNLPLHSLKYKTGVP
jgi:hypothetical protein